MRMIWNKGHRIRASDKHLVYHFSIETLLFVFVAVLHDELPLLIARCENKSGTHQ